MFVHSTIEIQMSVLRRVILFVLFLFPLLMVKTLKAMFNYFCLKVYTFHEVLYHLVHAVYEGTERLEVTYLPTCTLFPFIL